MPVPPEFLLIILLLAVAVVFAYFYLKRAQARTPKAPPNVQSEPAMSSSPETTDPPTFSRPPSASEPAAAPAAPVSQTDESGTPAPTADADSTADRASDQPS